MLYEVITIAPLPTDEAVKLLRAWGGDRAENEEAARQICEMVGGLPLAVRLAGRYLSETGEPASEYLEWLKETPLEALDQGKRKLESVPLLIRRSLDQVSEAARNADVYITFTSPAAEAQNIPIVARLNKKIVV